MRINWKIFVLLLVVATGPLFQLILDWKGNTDTMDFFLFSDTELTAQTWFYFLNEKIRFILVAYVLRHEETVFKKPLEAFFWLQIVDLIQYILFYKFEYVVYGFPLTINTVGLCIFGYYVFRYGRNSGD